MYCTWNLKVSLLTSSTVKRHQMEFYSILEMEQKIDLELKVSLAENLFVGWRRSAFSTVQDRRRRLTCHAIIHPSGQFLFTAPSCTALGGNFDFLEVKWPQLTNELCPNSNNRRQKVASFPQLQLKELLYLYQQEEENHRRDLIWCWDRSTPPSQGEEMRVKGLRDGCWLVQTNNKKAC